MPERGDVDIFGALRYKTAISRRPPMKFGIFIFGDNHPELGRSNQRYYEEVLTIGESAEELGFDSFWLGEHHLYWYGTCVSPPMIIAALGQRTERIRLGPAVSVLPLRHPLLVAEEYALADNLCGGRLNFAIGSGFSPVEYKTFGMSMEEAREKYWESFDVILKAWSQEQFSHQGKYYQVENGSLYMKPVQKPMPPTWIAASSDETLIRAGELGFPIMGIPFVRSTSLLEVKQKNDLFMDSYFRAGHKEVPDIVVALHVYLHKSQEAALQAARPCFERVLDYLKKYRRPGARVPDFDTIKKDQLAIFTMASDACAIFREYEKIGVTHIICMVNFGGVPMADVRRTLELMSAEIFPQIRSTQHDTSRMR
jgi:alkanesulfonate monooxygenase SsuD/methylene tetrahydromethanopterin reductase-like flavin-dependent oxidoreductase (luciferase family)